MSRRMTMGTEWERQQALIARLNADYEALMDDPTFRPDDDETARIAGAVVEVAERHELSNARDSGTNAVYATGDGIEVCGWYDTANREDGGFDDQVWAEGE